MPQLTPITDAGWVAKQAYKANAYGQTRHLRLCYLPNVNIVPEDFQKHLVYDVELMLVCLRAGAWLNGADWRPYARFTIAKRIKERQSLLFTGVFLKLKDEIMEYQVNGGSFTVRDKLRKTVSIVRMHPKSGPYERTMARLVASITDPIEENTLIQPFHWIRAVLATTERSKQFGLSLYNSENLKQIQTLCDILKAPSLNY